MAHALYQHDAACRVIARLTRERDQARQALATLQPTSVVAPVAENNDGAMEVDAADEGDDGMTAEIIEKLVKASKVLSKGRKKKKEKAPELATQKDIANYTEVSCLFVCLFVVVSEGWDDIGGFT